MATLPLARPSFMIESPTAVGMLMRHEPRQAAVNGPFAFWRAAALLDELRRCASGRRPSSPPPVGKSAGRSGAAGTAGGLVSATSTGAGCGCSGAGGISGNSSVTGDGSGTATSLGMALAKSSTPVGSDGVGTSTVTMIGSGSAMTAESATIIRRTACGGTKSQASPSSSTPCTSKLSLIDQRCSIHERRVRFRRVFAAVARGGTIATIGLSPGAGGEKV